MLAAAVLEQDPAIDDAAVLDLVASNLCRCTGYQSIIAAVRAAADRMLEEGYARGPRRRS
jgi:carbon-monoxide dehydrogenase small subunit